MNRFFIEITEPADNDLKDIGNYIAKELLESQTARNVINRIGNTILSLEEMPLRNSLVEDERLALQGFRKILLDNYIIFYIVEEENDIVTIVRVLYSRRDWINLL